MPHIIVIVVTLSQSKVGQSKRCKIGFRQKGIEFPTNALKAELYSIIQRLKPTPGYVVDDMAATAGKYSVKVPFYLLICTSCRPRGGPTSCCSLHSQSY